MTGYSRTAPATAPNGITKGQRSCPSWVHRRFSSSSSTADRDNSSSPKPAPVMSYPSPSMLGSGRPSVPSASHSSSPCSFSPIHPEPDKRGNLEYKLRILPVTPSRFSRLVTQLKWRLAEGGGLAVYEIGVLDDGTLIGLPEDEMRGSLIQLAMMGSALGADCEVRRCILVSRGSSVGCNEAADDLEGSASDLSALEDTNTEARLRSPHMLPYRHRLGQSTKNQSPGLDNIVGLRALSNEEASVVLGPLNEATKRPGWRFRIDGSESEEEAYALGTGGTPSSSSCVTGTATPIGDEDDDKFGEEDGFAFSLSLSDEEESGTKQSGWEYPASRSRASRSISNSPWEVRTPDLRPAGGREFALVLPHNKIASPSETLYLPAVVDKQPIDNDSDAVGAINNVTALITTSCDVSSSPPSMLDHTPKAPASHCAVLQHQQQQHHFTDLAGLDVEGVLKFSLASSPSVNVKKPKKRSGRRGREERQRVESLLFHDGGDDIKANRAVSPPGPLDHAEPFPPPQGQSHDATAKSHYSRGPRLERRARRLAELKAREREGEGVSLSLWSPEPEPSPVSLEERRKWWRYAGLSFEVELPHYDSVRQAWVREVAEWLTVDEVRNLAESWTPDDSERLRPDDGESDESSRQKRCDQLQGNSNHTAATEKNHQATVDCEATPTRKSLNRRRRKDRRRAETCEAEGLHRRNNNSSYRPEFVPPPSPAVTVPTSKGDHAIGSMYARVRDPHPLSRSQISDLSEGGDDDDGSESFGTGLTLNIDEMPKGVAPVSLPYIGAVGTNGDSAPSTMNQDIGLIHPYKPCLATSPSPSATSTVTNRGEGGSLSSSQTAIVASRASALSALAPRPARATEPTKEGQEAYGAGEEAARHVGEGDKKKLRYIVEAVLSLTVRGSRIGGKGTRRRGGASDNELCTGGQSLSSELVDILADDNGNDDDDKEGMSGWTLD